MLIIESLVLQVLLSLVFKNWYLLLFSYFCDYFLDFPLIKKYLSVLVCVGIELFWFFDSSQMIFSLGLMLSVF